MTIEKLNKKITACQNRIAKLEKIVNSSKSYDFQIKEAKQQIIYELDHINEYQSDKEFIKFGGALQC